jgi:AcrR family transcriptional regulator
VREPVRSAVRELRRGQIIAAARRIVAEEGLEALTIGSLEANLSFTRGVITYHFRGKDEIALAVLDSAVAEIDTAMRAAVEASAGPEDRVLAVLRGQVHGYLAHPEATRVLLSFWGRIGSDRRIARANARLYTRYREQAARLASALSRHGAFDGESPDAVASLLVGAVIGIACQALFDPGAIDPDAAVAAAARLLTRRRPRN